MSWVLAAWSKWQTWRMFCRYCHEVLVEKPDLYCSFECEDYAMLENGAA